MDLFLNVPDLQAKMEHYLDSPGQRIETARRAQQRILESHLYEHRAAAILDHARGLRASSPGHAAARLSRKLLGSRWKGPRTAAKLEFVTLPSGVQVAATRVRSP